MAFRRICIVSFCPILISLQELSFLRPFLNNFIFQGGLAATVYDGGEEMATYILQLNAGPAATVYDGGDNCFSEYLIHGEETFK